MALSLPRYVSRGRRGHLTQPTIGSVRCPTRGLPPGGLSVKIVGKEVTMLAVNDPSSCRAFWNMWAYLSDRGLIRVGDLDQCR